MSTSKIARRWAKRWSKVFTDATNARISFYLSDREAGKSYFVMQKLKRPYVIRRLRALKQLRHITCSRKYIKGRRVSK